VPTPFLQIDAFADEPFGGNPAAVCLAPPDARPADDLLQAVAAEMNLSETAFVTPIGGSAFGLRWFTPAIEVDLCGHATLASAAAVWEWGLVARETPVEFRTRSGPLRCTQENGLIEVDLPAGPPAEAGAAVADAVAMVLGAPARWVGVTPLRYLFAEVEDEAAVASAAPDLGALRALPYVGLIVTAPAGESRCDFVSRFFAPAAGVDEDPVCGSAHGAMGPYWADRLGNADLTAIQLSGRRGTLRVRPRGNRVRLAGRAVTVLRGELLVDLAG